MKLYTKKFAEISDEEVQKIQDAIDLLFGDYGIFFDVARVPTTFGSSDYALLDENETYEQIESICDKMMKFNQAIADNEKQKDLMKLDVWNSSIKNA